MADLTEQEQLSLMNGYAQSVHDNLVKSHGIEYANAVFDTVGRSGGISPQQLLAAAQSLPASQVAEAFAEAAFRDRNMPDEAWNRIRQKQKAESRGRPWSTKR